jgi:signal transduction histidine kinase
MKRISLLWKLLVAFLLVAISSIALVAIFIRLTSADRLGRLIIDQQRSDMETVLIEYYQLHGSWNGVSSEWQTLLRARSPESGQQAISTPPPEFNGGDPNAPQPNHDRRSLLGLADPSGNIIISVDPAYPEGSQLPAANLQKGYPIQVDNKTVGILLVANRTPDFNPAEALFLSRTNEALMMAALAGFAVALLIGAVLARTLIRPLQALTSAAHRIAAGQLEQEVTVNSGDEIGELGGAFNRMSQQVSQANRLRKQMTADIAHDLRTPLTVIAGYIESMRDGVLQPTPDRLAIIYQEIEGLQNLVTDLRMLSQMDAGELPLNRQRVTASELIEHAAAPFRHLAEKQNITLVSDVESDLPDLDLDEARMMQVYGNLLSNALRYTPEGGQICLGARRMDNAVVLTVKDNGVGIVEEELPFIFDRFHRVDKSRHADSGETGLGLAIVRALVEAQQGKVQAYSHPGEGLALEMRFPSVH